MGDDTMNDSDENEKVSSDESDGGDDFEDDFVVDDEASDDDDPGELSAEFLKELPTKETFGFMANNPSYTGQCTPDYKYHAYKSRIRKRDTAYEHEVLINISSKEDYSMLLAGYEIKTGTAWQASQNSDGDGTSKLKLPPEFAFGKSYSCKQHKTGKCKAKIWIRTLVASDRMKISFEAKRDGAITAFMRRGMHTCEQCTDLAQTEESVMSRRKLRCKIMTTKLEKQRLTKRQLAAAGKSTKHQADHKWKQSSKPSSQSTSGATSAKRPADSSNRETLKLGGTLDQDRVEYFDAMNRYVGNLERELLRRNVEMKNSDDYKNQCNAVTLELENAKRKLAATIEVHNDQFAELLKKHQADMARVGGANNGEALNALVERHQAEMETVVEMNKQQQVKIQQLESEKEENRREMDKLKESLESMKKQAQLDAAVDVSTTKPPTHLQKDPAPTTVETNITPIDDLPNLSAKTGVVNTSGDPTDLSKTQDSTGQSPKRGIQAVPPQVRVQVPPPPQHGTSQNTVAENGSSGSTTAAAMSDRTRGKKPPLPPGANEDAISGIGAPTRVVDKSGPVANEGGDAEATKTTADDDGKKSHGKDASNKRRNRMQREIQDFNKAGKAEIPQPEKRRRKDT